MTALPDTVLVETTTRCNLVCRMCARAVDRRPTGDLPWPLFQRLLPMLAGVRHVMLTGHGEPLLNPAFFAMLAAARRAGTSVETTTNASLLDPDTAAELVRAGLDQLVVSLDAATPDTFSMIRGFPLACLLDNLMSLQACKEKMGVTRPEISVNAVGMLLNMRELPDIVTLARRFGARRLAILPLTEYRPMAGQSLLRNPVMGGAWLRAARARAELLQLSFTVIGEYQRLLEPVRPRRFFSLRRCPQPSFAFVQRTGNVLPCCYSNASMGNLATDDLRVIWQSSRWQRFRQRRDSWWPPRDCRRCRMATREAAS